MVVHGWVLGGARLQRVVVHGWVLGGERFQRVVAFRWVLGGPGWTHEATGPFIHTGGWCEFKEGRVGVLGGMDSLDQVAITFAGVSVGCTCCCLRKVQGSCIPEGPLVAVDRASRWVKELSVVECPGSSQLSSL